jgi:hypothetical protein
VHLPCDTHGTVPGGEDALEREALLLDLVGAPHVLARLAEALRLAVKQDGRARLGHEEEVDELHHACMGVSAAARVARIAGCSPPKMSCTQKIQRQDRYASTKGPTMGPMDEPPTEEKTT